MKKIYLVISIVLSLSVVQAQSLKGAWKQVTDATKDQITIKLYSNAYFTSSTYIKSSGEFISASGGTFSINKSDYIENYEIDSKSRAVTGTFLNFNYKLENDTLQLNDKNSRNSEVWVKIDEAEKENVTSWKIHEVFRDSKWTRIEDKPRKTVKMLTDNHYQVLALNSQTGEFFGSSGGKWTYDNDKHHEIIYFFSKNQSMVGDTLSFKKKIKNDIWSHNGKSSEGEYIQERWKKFK